METKKKTILVLESTIITGGEAAGRGAIIDVSEEEAVALTSLGRATDDSERIRKARIACSAAMASRRAARGGPPLA